SHVVVSGNGVRLRQTFPRPSPLLTRAADMLRADEWRGERPWERWLDTTGRTGLEAYDRPAAKTDRLVGQDQNGRPLRHPARHPGRRRGLPTVHHGRIGSADWSVRDAGIRDELARRYGLRALEMEGAGVGNSAFLNGLEWFMVRGVSDYADSAMTERWRR